MAFRILLLLPILAVLALAGCGKFDRAERPAWRDRAEEVCLAEGRVRATSWLQPAKAIEGPGICGLNHPFRVYALADGTVRLNSASVLDCSMIPMLDAWIRDVVQPDAMARFGEPVVQIDTMGTYSCRGINGSGSGKLSEHAFGNAMDVGGFVLASGRKVNVMRGWKSADAQEAGFLQDAHAGACTYFTTVLGPGANIFHYNHIHMDLAMHGNTSRGVRRYCKPVPAQQIPAPKQDDLPDPPPLDEEMDIAKAPIPAPAYGGGASSFVASAPAAPAGYRPPSPLVARPVRLAARPSAATPAPLSLLPAQPRRLAVPPALDIDQAGGPAPAIDPDTDITALIEQQSGQ